MSLKYRIGAEYPTLPAKDPTGVMFYTFDYSEWLSSSDSEIITESSWAVDTGITQDLSVFTDTEATINVSGGTRSKRYKLTNTITTSEGRTTVRSCYLPIKRL